MVISNFREESLVIFVQIEKTISVQRLGKRQNKYLMLGANFSLEELNNANNWPQYVTIKRSLNTTGKSSNQINQVMQGRIFESHQT